VTSFFLAVVPPEALGARIEAFRTRWGNPHHKVEPHITIKAPFPWTAEPEALLAPLGAVCSTMAPFEVRLGPSSRFAEARVLYLTVHSPALHQLHTGAVGALTGLVPVGGHEGEHYTPHLTLAVGRFGISPEGLDHMEREAAIELGGLPAFPVTALRCYRRAKAEERWQPMVDLPLG